MGLCLYMQKNKGHKKRTQFWFKKIQIEKGTIKLIEREKEREGKG